LRWKFPSRFDYTLRFDSGTNRGDRPRQGDAMPKQKTHKGMLKRFKVTAKGKVKCRSAGRGHILSSKSPKRKRHLRKDTVLTKWEPKMVIEGLRPVL
jgi:large subunit ribosomal protein L35